jgi:hypothetical protein
MLPEGLVRQGSATVVVKYDCNFEVTQVIQGDGGVNEEAMELVHGSGNVFRDFGHADAAVLQMKAILAAEIIKMREAGSSLRSEWKDRKAKAKTEA